MAKINHHRRSQVSRASRERWEQWQYYVPKYRKTTKPKFKDLGITADTKVTQYSNVSQTQCRNFYKSDAWLNMRKQVHRKFNKGYCNNCGVDWKYPLKGMTPQVDHIKPLAYYWHLRLDMDNLQVLCEYCNSVKGRRMGSDMKTVMQKARHKRLKQIEHYLKNK